MLSPVDQTMLRRLALFVDGATLDTILAVCTLEATPDEASREPPTDTLMSLARLVDQSLLQRTDDLGGAPRFRLLHITRVYAQASWTTAAEASVFRARLAQYFLSLAKQASAEIHRKHSSSWVHRPDHEAGSSRGRWMERLDREMGDLRAARAFFLGDPAWVAHRLRLAAALYPYWAHRGELAEGRTWLEEAIAASRDLPVPDPDRANALYAAGKLAEHQGDYAAAAFLREAIRLLRTTGDAARLADALAWHACVSFEVCPEPERRALIEESLAIYQQLADIPGQAKAFNFFGEMARLAGDYDRATEFYEQSLALYQQAEDSGALAVIRHNLGYVAQHRQDYARATVLFSDALALYRHYGDRRLLVICLAALAAVASIGRPERAARLFAAAEAHLETMGTRMQPADLAEHQRNVADVRTAMEEQAFQRAWAEGRTMSLEQALAYVQEAAPGAPPVGQDRSPRPASAPAEQLTARELEVADLIARGLTNRQIALRLVIAERTVDKHVGNILAKFGFASRAQIAAWAATERLGR